MEKSLLFLKKRVLISSILGNALEFYDFTLYGVLASVLARHYFPAEDPTAKLLFSLAAFAVGFLTRPIGAMFFGRLGDSIGRKKALSLSIFLMGIPTFVIGITPTYDEIGVWSSILIFVCRLLQGMFTGGEYNGAAIFSIEHFPKSSSGFVGGLITGSCVIGAVGATFFGVWTQNPSLPPWAWRVPFLFGGLIGAVGYFIRKNLDETPEFISSQKESRISLLKLYQTHPYPSLIAFVFGSFNGALTYTLFGFLNIYLSRYLHMSLVQAMRSNLFGLFSFMIASPLMGALLDFLGRKKFLSCVVCFIFIWIIPIFLLLRTPYAWLGQILMGLCTASIAGSGHAIMQEFFPVKQRYQGIAFNFSMGMGIFGGITPMIYVVMIEKLGFNLLFPALFLMILNGCFFAIGTSAGFFTNPSLADRT